MTPSRLPDPLSDADGVRKCKKGRTLRRGKCLPALDESSLSEVAGISAPPAAHDFYVQHYCGAPIGAFVGAWPGDGPIDWNCNSPVPLLPPDFLQTIDPGTVQADVNGDGQHSLFPATHNEWVTLDYASGGGIGPR